MACRAPASSSPHSVVRSSGDSRAPAIPRADNSAERPGASPSQNGQRGLRAVRIFHANLALTDVADAPGVRAQQKHVAGEALDGEVFVDGADGFAFGFGDDGIGGGSRESRRPR